VGLPKGHRLKHWQDFKTVYARGKRCHGEFLVLVAHHAPNEKFTRFGISISRKVSKKAVIRNKIKRHLRRACRELLPQSHQDWQLIIIVRSGAVSCEYEHFLRELKQLLIKAEVFYGH